MNNPLVGIMFHPYLFRNPINTHAPESESIEKKIGIAINLFDWDPIMSWHRNQFLFLFFALESESISFFALELESY